jgi:hypothetical protein
MKRTVAGGIAVKSCRYCGFEKKGYFTVGAREET